MLLGIIVYRNRLPKLLLRSIHFIPIALTATYLVLIATIILPIAVALCLVLGPILYFFWRAKQNRFNPVFLRIMYPFEMIGLTIVNSPKIAAQILDSTKRIRRPNFHTVKMDRGRAMFILIRSLAILGIIGVAVYLVAVAVVVLPIAMGCCLLLAPLCYLFWYVKEKKFIPLFQKVPVYIEQLGFSIVNSRKIMTNWVLGIKNLKWPMF